MATTTGRPTRKTAAKKAAASSVPSITVAGKRKITAKDRSRFTVDDEVFHLLRPKQAVFGRYYTTAMQNGGQLDQATMLAFAVDLLPYVEATPPTERGVPTGQMRLRQRLNDPLDDLDLDDLAEVFSQLLIGFVALNALTADPASRAV